MMKKVREEFDKLNCHHAEMLAALTGLQIVCEAAMHSEVDASVKILLELIIREFKTRSQIVEDLDGAIHAAELAAA